MLQLSYRGGGALRVDEATDPVPGPGEVRVRVRSAGICMSDVYGVSGRNDRRDVVLGEDGVLVMGHEVAGEIDALGPGVDGPPVGTPVAVNPIFGCGECAVCARGDVNLCAARTVHGCVPSAPGGFAELLTVPARNAVPLAPGTSHELGALVEPLAVGFHGVRLAALRPDERVLVVGGGIIGLGAALAAQRLVGDRVLVLEPRPERRALAEALGLRAGHPDELAAADGDVDVAVDCVARPETFAGAVRAVPHGGRVVLVGIWSDEIPLPVSAVVGRETHVIGSYGYSHEDVADVAAWVGSGAVDLAPLVQHRVGWDDLIGAFDGYADGSLTAIRTLFQPTQDTPA
jgi:2-desacetyl-2-hydroxyethyl bacteriochlorophyllide A dehydrogenase